MKQTVLVMLFVAINSVNIFAASPSYKDGSGVMSDGNKARANLQEKLEQARRLLKQISDLTTTEGLKKFIADLENRLRNTDPKYKLLPVGWTPSLGVSEAGVMARRKTQSRVQDRGGWAGNASTGRADAWVRLPRAEPEAKPAPCFMAVHLTRDQA